MIAKKDLFKFGIGTWGVGGFAQVDPQNDDQKQIDAIAYALSKGINYVETVFYYAQGKAAQLLAQAVKKSGLPRDKIFITQSVYLSTAPTIDAAENEVNTFLKYLDTSYIDSLQFTMGGMRVYGLDKISSLVEKFLRQEKIRYVSLTNANLEYLKKFSNRFSDKMFAHECVFNFEIRENEKLGITDFAKEHKLLNVVYQPLRRNRTAQRNWPLLVTLAQKYGRTQNQILLNWIVSKGFFPLNKSSSQKHIDENLAAFDFEIEKEDLKKLNDFTPPGYETPKIDWMETGDGVIIHQLPNVFDEIYKPK